MSKIFIGGSRHVSHLNMDVLKHLDDIIKNGFPVLVGDANGADKAVQTYLHSKHYGPVEVFCTEGICRNNVGHWAIRSIESDSRERNAQFYTAKDKVMTEEATFGFMVWDGKSIGTLLNVFRLLNQQKTAVIYIVPHRCFHVFNELHEWDDFIARCDSAIRQKVEQRVMQEVSGRRPVANSAQIALLL